ncbi:ABC transporter permease [Streptococcus oricebi]|uniref:Multidrug ABC transporter permease n=1 Tax=Streptococcus oricebi TaxID=1547447 RepID=A0ABS5B1M0_9STRE|nr:ABC transporter permease [Streptococcus oricebi]MBP2622655.1 multidrug ABC transporter permease [Streptococcus oricebi]
MLMLVKRNCWLYFRNRSGVFTSLLGALISFFLYLIFLKANIKADWARVPNTNTLLDFWLIGGTLTITGLTTSLSALGQLVADREKQVANDLYLTDLGPWGLEFSYLLTATFISFIMQVLVFLVMVSYFCLTDQINFSLSVLPELSLVMLLSAALASLFNLLIVRRFHSLDNLGRFANIVGAASGFLVGTYVPIGSLPQSAQYLMKLTPSTYIASLFRQVMMKEGMATAFVNNEKAADQFEKIMGIRLHWDSLLTRQETYYIVVVVLTLLLGLWILLQARTSRLLKVKVQSRN